MSADDRIKKAEEETGQRLSPEEPVRVPRPDYDLPSLIPEEYQEELRKKWDMGHEEMARAIEIAETLCWAPPRGGRPPTPEPDEDDPPPGIYFYQKMLQRMTNQALAAHHHRMTGNNMVVLDRFGNIVYPSEIANSKDPIPQDPEEEKDERVVGEPEPECGSACRSDSQ